MDEENSEDSNVSTFYSSTFYECGGEDKRYISNGTAMSQDPMDLLKQSCKEQ